MFWQQQCYLRCPPLHPLLNLLSLSFQDARHASKIPKNLLFANSVEVSVPASLISPKHQPLTTSPWSSRLPQFPYHHFSYMFFLTLFWLLLLVYLLDSLQCQWAPLVIVPTHPHPQGTHIICEVILSPCSCWHLLDPCLHLWTHPRAPTGSHWITQPQALESPNQFHYLYPSLKTRPLVTKTLSCLYFLSE